MGSLNLLAKRVGENPTSDGKEMAALLKYHWGDTFAKKDVDFKDLDTWWKDDGYSFKPEVIDPPPVTAAAPQTPDRAWTLTVEHVERAIRYSNDSSPGPDGIPCKAWR
eukprot:12066468-Heterocapsa_arctica.AAC.1